VEMSFMDGFVRLVVGDGLGFLQVPGQSFFRRFIRGMNGSWTCFARAMEGDDLFVFTSFVPEEVGERTRPEVALLLSHLNPNIPYGSFGMDMDMGYVVFRTVFSVGTPIEQSFVQARHQLDSHLVTMDLLLPLIQSVICGEACAREAIANLQDSTTDKSPDMDGLPSRFRFDVN